MAGYKGMTHKKSHIDSPRFPEYYKNLHPEWNDQKCIEESNNFKKSCNYKCIEYWKRKYPNLSIDELEKLRKQINFQAKTNNKNNKEYYQKRFPNLSNEEIEQMWHDYAKSNNACNLIFWELRYKDKLSHNEIVEKWQTWLKKFKESLPDVSGENNPMWHEKHTKQELKENSPFSKEFYKKRNLSEDDYKNFINSIVIPIESQNTKIEYYLNKGMSLNEAKKALYDRQSTFTLEKCIKKYGEELGTKKFNERQIKWRKKLQNSFFENGCKNIPQSKLANDIINILQEKFPNIKREKYLYNKNIKHGYFYDLSYKNKLIEINGDYWHCNPKFFDNNYYNKTKDMMAKDIWKYDNEKIEFAINEGYKIITIWENDYNEDPEKIINECINFLND